MLVASALLTLIFLLLSGIHGYWALGGRWGSGAVFPELPHNQSDFKPGPLPTLVVAAGLLLFGGVVAGRGGWLSFFSPQWAAWFGYGTWAIAGIFLLRAVGEFRYVGFFKSVRHTRFAYWDSRLYSPLCLVIAILAGYLAAFPA